MRCRGTENPGPALADEEYIAGPTTCTDGVEKCLPSSGTSVINLRDWAPLGNCRQMRLLFALILAFSTLTACGDSSGVDWRALGQASCSLSMHCNPSEYAKGGSGYSKREYGVELENSVTNYKGAITIAGTSLCPRDIRLGRLTHEQRSGLNKICFYK